MAIDIIGINRAKQRIKLTDEPDSPEFVLDLTTTALGKNLTKVFRCAMQYTQAHEQAETAVANGDDDAYIEAAGVIAQAYEGIVTTMLGAEAWDAVLDYVGDGEKLEATELSIAIMPLVEYLLTKFNDLLGITRRAAEAKYLDPDNDPDAI